MTDVRRAYDDPATLAEMHTDCLAVQASLTRPLAVAAHALSQEQSKAVIDIPEAAARLAGALHLQLDGD